MTRLYGWAPKGVRLIDKVPHSHWETATFLAALRSDRIAMRKTKSNALYASACRDEPPPTEPPVPQAGLAIASRGAYPFGRFKGSPRRACPALPHRR
jgi:hypothetical protein